MKREPDVYCERVLQDDVAVAYLRGQLPEAERDAFEEHYFECADCFERLQTVRQLHGMLREPGVVAGATAPARKLVPRRGPSMPWLAMAAGAAFVAVGAAFVLRNAAPPQPIGATPPAAVAPSPEGATAAPVVPEPPPLDVLARVEPPPYAPLVLRGGAAETAFDRAMEKYVRGDYAGAAEGLRAAAKEDPESGDVLFYLGVSELLAGRPQQAIGVLRMAGAADPAFSEAAWYYMAKAHLARGDVAKARNALALVAKSDGDHKQRALSLLRALPVEP